MYAVRASGLGKTFPGDVCALDDLTISVESGAVFGLLGPNGAGKTTAVRLLNGTLTASAGTAEVFGEPASASQTRQRTATLAETARMYDHMSPVQNLKFFGTMYGLGGPETDARISELLVQMGLAGREHDKLGTFSIGMKKRVQLARTLLHRPDLVFLDEPTSGLDPEAARQVTDLIRTLAQDDGTTVILCTHNLPFAEKVCNVFGFLSEGHLVASGNREELTAGVNGQTSVEVVSSNGIESFAIQAEEEINGHLRRLMDAGAFIREVRTNDPDLESLYFQYVGGSEDEPR